MPGERTFFKLRCKAGSEAEYVRRHENVWPVVKRDLAAAGVLSMNIWMDKSDVFLMMETKDYAAATAALDASPDSVKWEKWMEPMMETGDGGAYDPLAAYPDGLPCVFSWKAPQHGTGEAKSAVRALTAAGTAALLLLPAVALEGRQDSRKGLLASFSLLSLYIYHVTSPKD